MNNNNVNIKTLEMTRRIRDANHERLSGKPPHERISFYREKAQQLYDNIEKLPQKSIPENCVIFRNKQTAKISLY